VKEQAPPHEFPHHPVVAFALAGKATERIPAYQHPIDSGGSVDADEARMTTGRSASPAQGAQA
jgi:hypothetical protein